MTANETRPDTEVIEMTREESIQTVVASRRIVVERIAEIGKKAHRSDAAMMTVETGKTREMIDVTMIVAREAVRVRDQLMTVEVVVAVLSEDLKTKRKTKVTTSGASET